MDASALPASLRQPYAEAAYIARVPFLINPIVDDASSIETLQNLDIGEKDLFIGIAGLRALDLIAAIGRKNGQGYRHAVLIDQNTNQVKAMNAVCQLIEESEDADGFIRAFARHYEKWVSKVPRLHRDYAYKAGAQRKAEDWNYFAVYGNAVFPRSEKEALEELRQMRLHPSSWLADANFAFIKHMVEKRRLHTAIIDLGDKERVSALLEWMGTNGLHARDLYISSLEVFHSAQAPYDYYGRPWQPDSREVFFENLKALSRQDDEGARLIYAQIQPGPAPQRFALKVAGHEALDQLALSARKTNVYQRPVAVGNRSLRLLATYRTPAGESTDTLTAILLAELQPFTPAELTALRSAFINAGFRITEGDHTSDYVKGESPLEGRTGEAEARLDELVNQVSTALRPMHHPGKGSASR